MSTCQNGVLILVFQVGIYLCRCNLGEWCHYATKRPPKREVQRESATHHLIKGWWNIIQSALMNHNSLVVSCIFFEELPTMMSVDMCCLFFRLGQFWSDFLFRFFRYFMSYAWWHNGSLFLGFSSSLLKGNRPWEIREVQKRWIADRWIEPGCWITPPLSPCDSWLGAKEI